MFVRDGAVTPGPSCKCDITFFVKGRPKSARQSRDSTVAARSVQSVTVPSSWVSRECRSPGLRSPPLEKCPMIVQPKLADQKGSLAAQIPSRPKLLQKNSLQRKCFEAINFVKITKQSLYKTNSLACFLAKRDTPVAATLQRKSFGGIIFVIITKKITKIIVSGNYFVIISARMVVHEHVLTFEPQDDSQSESQQKNVVCPLLLVIPS